MKETKQSSITPEQLERWAKQFQDVDDPWLAQEPAIVRKSQELVFDTPRFKFEMPSGATVKFKIKNTLWNRIKLLLGYEQAAMYRVISKNDKLEFEFVVLGVIGKDAPYPDYKF